jgi:hypothetical protein
MKSGITLDNDSIRSSQEQLIFTLRFLPGSPKSFQDESVHIVNIYQFLDDQNYLDVFVAFLRNEIMPLVDSKVSISYQGDDLRNDLRNEILSTSGAMTHEKLIRARDLLAAYLSNFWYLEESQKIRWSAVSQENESINQWERGLYVRGGIVELRVVENVIYGELDNYPRLNFTSKSMGQSDLQQIPVSDSVKKHWMDTSDVNQNIADLMTNAGWYPNESFDLKELKTWAKLYSDAYVNAIGVFRCPGIDPYENGLELSKKSSHGKGFTYFNFPNRERFYNLLEGQRVLFLSPFASEIDQMHKSRRLYELWNDLEIPDFNLQVIQSPMSIFPNRPGKSWLETFDNLKRLVQDSVDNYETTLFFASAGSYGLPICDFVNSSFDIASVYGGNYINYLFGIRQNATENDFYSPRRVLSNWTSSSLGMISGLAKIDEGRYVFTSDEKETI